MKRLLIPLFVVLALIAAAAWVPVGGTEEGIVIEASERVRVERIDLSAWSTENPEKPLRLLFIHHSCGGQLLADPGAEVGEACIYASHPNGGGLRQRLEVAGYQVHEASYGSAVGQDTDWHHWLPKFRDRMERVLACAGQDRAYEGGERNDVVLFKSCFPNNQFAAEGEPPGRAGGGERTVWNARAACEPLLEEFARHPGVLFVCLTPPPLAPRIRPEPLWKALARKVLDRPRTTPAELARSGALARRFNDWLAARDGWLAGYEGKNVAVFDYYDLLTGEGGSNLSAYPTGEGCDAHPSAEGNRVAAEALVPFLNRCVRRAGLGAP